MRKFLFLFFVSFSGFTVSSQNADIDSLQLVLSKLQAKDPAYVNVANEIAFRLSMTDQQKSIYYINLAISVAKDLNYEKGLIRAITLKGNSFLVIGLPDQALSFYLEVLAYDLSKYPMEHMRISNNIGEVYRRKGVYDSSIKYFTKALEISEKYLDDFEPVIVYSNLGEVNLMQEKIESAKGYFELCLEKAIETKDLRGQGYGYYGLAECSFAEDNLFEAIQLMKKSLAVRNVSNHQRGLIQSYLKLGNYYSTHKATNLVDSASYYWENAREIAEKNKANDLLNEAYNKLYSHYLDKSEINKAAYYLKLHKNLGDSIRNAEFISNVEKMQTALKSELILAENKLLRQEQIQSESEDDARLIVLTLAFTIVLGLGFATYQYRKRQKAFAESF